MVRRTLAGPVASGAFVSIGWARASSRDLLRASAAGVGLGVVYLFVLVPAIEPSPGRELGPLASAALAGGWARHAWAFLAVLVAPPVEEFVFRGVLLTGFRRSWGLAPAGALVSVLFVAAHFSEIANAARHRRHAGREARRPVPGAGDRAARLVQPGDRDRDLRVKRLATRV